MVGDVIGGETAIPSSPRRDLYLGAPVHPWVMGVADAVRMGTPLGMAMTAGGRMFASDEQPRTDEAIGRAVKTHWPRDAGRPARQARPARSFAP